MRHVLAMAFLGMTLAVGTSAALAGDNTGDKTLDPFPAYQMQAPEQSAQFSPAGTPSQPTWLQQYRLENSRQ